MTQQINWQPHPGPQTEALKRAEFEILYGGARGGGKTDAGMAWLLRHIDNPRYRTLIIRKNVDDLSDWIDRARRMYRDTGASFAYRPTIITFPFGAIFRTGHLKDPSSYEKYLGQEYQRMVVEELTTIPQEELYEKLIFSCRSTVEELRPQVFSTTNPGGPGHVWVKKRFIEIAPWGEPYNYKMKIEGQVIKRSRVFIHAKIEDNPTLVKADPGYILMLEQLKKTNPGLYRAWRHGDWDIVAGQVFSEWRRETHTVEPFEIPIEWKRYIAIDWGVNKPFTVGWYSQDYDGKTYLYKELYMNGIEFEAKFHRPLTPRRLARLIMAINKRSGEDYIYCVADPSMWNKSIGGKGSQAIEGGESIAETMVRAGLKMMKADNDRINGLGRYRQVLSIAPDGNPWYQVFNTCENTIRTIPALIYDTTKIEDVDTDGEDHCYDRDRYFFMSRPTKSYAPKKKEISKIREKYLKDTGRWELTKDYDEHDVYQREWEES